MRARLAILAAVCGIVVASQAGAQITRITNDPKALILQAAKVSAGSDIIFLSGQLASPVDPSKKPADVKTIEEMGDTKAQTISTLTKIREILAAQGYGMSDLVKLTLFVAADPRTGKMDFAGANEGFKTFFNTPDNPTTVARSTFQVANLVGPLFLIEIEAIAAKKPR